MCCHDEARIAPRDLPQVARDAWFRGWDEADRIRKEQPVQGDELNQTLCLYATFKERVGQN